MLGPTNTGKTHLAIERMLAHASGIIGFPLRLLARENYDRMVARKGARHVALITGEEKIVPPDARWFSCTVEAMPLDRPAEFVAVDEIQLCADPDRGHVFTDRLLHARGLVETIFLGAETIRPLLRRLVPGAEIETRPRLSQLIHAGPVKLQRLPPRSAVVAFSAGEVYAIAELIRRRRGGCAVVMGRLSPRTRNAQVALYQEKEVDFLVATDAIGMGLNMDVDHVAFAGLGKFDGHRPRRLAAHEVAQIAGRAGRGMRDGTFGATATCPPMPEDIVDAVEAHRFENLDALCWRNSGLDFSHVDALLDSLTAPPPGPGLVRGNEATDLLTLAALAREPDIRARAGGRAMVRLLWDACQIPDFRKLADESHVRLCARVFGHLAQDRTLPTDWLAGQIAALTRDDGDIDTLMQRLAGIRVWSYIAARADWVRDAVHWQARAREAEDKLSDALHERLTSRFVDRRASLLLRRLEESEDKALLSAVTARGEVIVEGHPVGHVAGFGFAPDPAAVGEARRLVLRAARRALRDEMPRRVAALEDAPDTEFALVSCRQSSPHLAADAGDKQATEKPLAGHDRIAWNGVGVARLKSGRALLHPIIHVLDSEYLDGAERERVRARLQRFLDGAIRRELAPLFSAAERAAGEPHLRGMVHRLMEAGGVVSGPGGKLAPSARGQLKSLGIRAGRFATFMPALLKPRPMALRAALWCVRHGGEPPAMPPPGAVSLARPEAWPEGFAAATGWVEAGLVLVRLDVAERVAADLAWTMKKASMGRPVFAPSDLASRLAIKAEQLPGVLRALGIRFRPAAALEAGQYGPPAPPVVQMPQRRHTEIRHPARREMEDGPFAALAALRP